MLELRISEYRYAPCLSSVFQFEFRDEKQKEFFQRTYFLYPIYALIGTPKFIAACNLCEPSKM